MATLQNIRNRSGLLIAVIGFAMLAFILMDLLGSGRFLFGKDPNVVIDINGVPITTLNFNLRYDQSEINYTSQNQRRPSAEETHNLKNSVYEEIIRETLLNRAYENIGIKISTTELWNEIKDNPELKPIKAQVELAAQAESYGSVEDLEKIVASEPENYQAAMELALAKNAKGNCEAAIDILLDILKHDLEWNSGEAKAQLLKILDSMNANDPIALKGRRKLSSIIFA